MEVVFKHPEEKGVDDIPFDTFAIAEQVLSNDKMAQGW